MKLRDLDGIPAIDTTHDITHSPHLLTTLGQLTAIWNGEFDVPDTSCVLRTEADRLIRLADAITRNTVYEHNRPHTPPFCPECGTELATKCCTTCGYHLTDGYTGLFSLSGAQRK